MAGGKWLGGFWMGGFRLQGHRKSLISINMLSRKYVTDIYQYLPPFTEVTEKDYNETKAEVSN